MSSGFVPGGTTEQPIERNNEWLKAQQEIEAQRRRKEEEGRHADGKSLYEVLEHNKAAKQEAFEESIRLKNQFRTLDDDEIEFLDSVLESTRAKEQALKKETAEQLNQFREQQEKADRAFALNTHVTFGDIDEGSPTRMEDSPWTVGARKRKRVKDKDGSKVVKVRRSSSVNEVASGESQSPASLLPQDKLSMGEKQVDTVSRKPSNSATEQEPHQKPAPTTALKKSPKLPSRPNLGLGDYSSDDD